MKIASAVVGMESSHQNISVQQSSLRLGIRMKKSEWEASQEMDREGDVQKDPQGEDKKEEKGKAGALIDLSKDGIDASKGVSVMAPAKEEEEKVPNHVHASRVAAIPEKYLQEPESF